MNPIKTKKMTKTIRPNPGTSLCKYVFGFRYKGSKGVISLSNILTREITIQNVITTGAVTSIPVNK